MSSFGSLGQIWEETKLIKKFQVNDLPVILADENFVGLGVLSSDEYTGGNGGADEWYINQVRLSYFIFSLSPKKVRKEIKSLMEHEIE
jgi:hypothetical protein